MANSWTYAHIIGRLYAVTNGEPFRLGQIEPAEIGADHRAHKNNAIGTTVRAGKYLSVHPEDRDRNRLYCWTAEATALWGKKREAITPTSAVELDNGPPLETLTVYSEPPPEISAPKLPIAAPEPEMHHLPPPAILGHEKNPRTTDPVVELTETTAELELESLRAEIKLLRTSDPSTAAAEIVARLKDIAPWLQRAILREVTERLNLTLG